MLSRKLAMVNGDPRGADGKRLQGLRWIAGNFGLKKNGVEHLLN